MEKIKLAIRKKSLLSKIKYSILRQIKSFLLFFIPKKYKEFVEIKGIDPKTLQPYILKITNNTNETLKEFKILSFKSHQNTKCLNDDGNYFIKKNKGEIIIESSIPNVYYKDILTSFTQIPFSVGLTYIMSANIEQITKVIEVKRKDGFGNEEFRTLVPTIDPYQQQTNIVAVRKNYTIYAFTDIIYSELLPNTIVNMYFYPDAIIVLPKTKFEKFLAWLKK
jgi:hypothetical protein